MGLSKADALTYNYGIFSSRTGNIYTTSLLHQWLSWADGSQQEPDEIWTQEGRTFDPFRPTVEPGGFDDAREMLMTRSETIKQFRTSVTDADLFVFTLGLTESWWNNEQGYEYPICPGTAAGDFDGSKHKFVNQDFGQVFEAMAKSLDQIRNLNPNIRVLLTVSPVPLTATATGGHVLVSTTYSKSVLRAVAGKLAQENDWVDYFPSYEIVTAPVFGGSAYADNQRSIRPEGVSFVMNHFFETIAPGVGHDRGAVTGPGSALATEEDVVCEEVLLDAFGPKK
jgi:hypothetical protein